VRKKLVDKNYFLAYVVEVLLLLS